MAIATAETRVEPSPEVLTEIPTIRAHHLIFAGWAMQLGELGAESPEAFTEYFTARVIRWLNSAHPVGKDYAETTVGVDKQRYKEALLGLKEFIKAEPDQDFTIVEEVPDSVVCGKMGPCDSHCRKRFAQLPNGRKVRLDEREVTSTFLKAASKFKIRYSVNYGMSDYTDAKPIRVRRITMKAGEIRSILSRMADPENGFADFFDDPFKMMDKMIE